jgi:hypothetical protein
MLKLSRFNKTQPRTPAPKIFANDASGEYANQTFNCSIVIPYFVVGD